MITVLVGENSFEIREEISRLTTNFSGDVERYDGESLDRATIADLFGGQTLFADERLIIIRDLSKNTAIWSQIEKLAESIANSTRIVLIEDKLDKRTAAYKALKSAGAIKEFILWGDRDAVTAQKWVIARGKASGLQLSSSEAGMIIERVGLDQWQLASAVEKLSLLNSVSVEAIKEHIDLNPKENVFQLFELALSSKKAELQTVLRTLMLTEDPYMVFALLSSQAVQLGIMSVAHDEPAAKDFGIHPFVATKLAAAARRQGPANVKRIVDSFAKADVRMKSTSVDPWQVVETVLLSI